MNGIYIENNPFYHRPKWDTLEIMKVFIGTFTIFPIKLTLMGFVFAFLYPAVVIAYWVGSRHPNFYNDRNLSETTIMLTTKPLSGKIYKKLLNWINFLDRALLWVAGFYYIDIIGVPSKDTRIFVCAPHSTFADSVVVMCPYLKSIVAKRAAGKIPILGTLVSFLQPIWVERDQSKSRKTAIQGIVKRVKDESNEWPQVCIFPEGTCTNRKCLISFKKGAFYPGVPIQPVCINYPNHFDCLTWTWDGPNTFFVIWWTLCQFKLDIQIEYLPVYYPSKAETEDPELYAENVRTVMASHLKVPKVDLTYEDCKKLLGSNSKTKNPLDILNDILQKIYVINKPTSETNHITNGTPQSYASLKYSTKSYHQDEFKDCLLHEIRPTESSNENASLVGKLAKYLEDTQGTIDVEQLRYVKQYVKAKRDSSDKILDQNLSNLCQTMVEEDKLCKNGIYERLITMIDDNPDKLKDICDILTKYIDRIDNSMIPKNHENAHKID